MLPAYELPGAGEPYLLDSEVLKREAWSEEMLRENLQLLTNKYSSLQWLIWLRSRLGIQLSDYLNDGWETHLSATELTSSSIAGKVPRRIADARHPAVLVGTGLGMELLAALFVMRRRRVEGLLRDFGVNTEDVPQSWRVFNQRAEKCCMLSFRGIGPLLSPCTLETPESLIFPWTSRMGPPTEFSLRPTDLSGLQSTPTPIICAQLVGDVMYLVRCLYNVLRADSYQQYRDQFAATGCVFFKTGLLSNLHNRGVEANIREALPSWAFGSSALFRERLRSAGICKVEEDATVFDLFYATCLLQESLERELVSMDDAWRAKCFADAVQNYLNHSPWNPGRAEKLRGSKPQRPDGQPLTDLDAVRVKAGHLLICECKAVSCGMLRRNPARSQWNRARNAVERYTRSWVTELKQHQMFTGFKGVSFVVVTPLPFPIHPKYLDRDDLGFPRTCSLDELAEKIGVERQVGYFNNVP
jgi:hypothetical protein